MQSWFGNYNIYDANLKCAVISMKDSVLMIKQFIL